MDADGMKRKDDAYMATIDTVRLKNIERRTTVRVRGAYGMEPL